MYFITKATSIIITIGKCWTVTEKLPEFVQPLLQQDSFMLNALIGTWTQTHKQNDVMNNSNFKKPGACQPFTWFNNLFSPIYTHSYYD